MTAWILAALALYIAQTLLPPLFRYVLRSDPQILATLGPRDTSPELGLHGSRAERALGNMTEAMLVFLPLALLAEGTGVTGAVFGAQLFVVARVAYVPTYLLGVPGLRSAIWCVGVVGLVIMAAAVLGHGM